MLHCVPENSLSLMNKECDITVTYLIIWFTKNIELHQGFLSFFKKKSDTIFKKMLGQAMLLMQSYANRHYSILARH